jgi:hypothetical protein
MKLMPTQNIRGWHVVDRHDDLQTARAVSYRHCPCCDLLLAVDRTGSFAHHGDTAQRVDVA